MKALKYFADLVARGAVIGLVAGLVLSYMDRGPMAVKEAPVTAAPAVVQEDVKPDQVVPGVPRSNDPGYTELEERMLAEATVDELKQAYKNCNRALMDGKLGHGGIQMCAVVYETLKKKGFDNDYLKFHEWSKTWK